MTRVAHRFVTLAAGLALGLSACAKTLPPPPDLPIAERETYKIGTSDILAVSVWKNPEISLQQVPVRPDGKISVPLAGDVLAAGQTTEEVKKSIESALSEYITAPDVTVIVLKMDSQRVSVVGEVLRPGPVPLGPDTRILDAISAAGGFSPFAHKNGVRILRRAPDGSVAEYGFDYDGFIGGSQPTANFLLQAGDTVVVPD